MRARKKVKNVETVGMHLKVRKATWLKLKMQAAEKRITMGEHLDNLVAGKK